MQHQGVGLAATSSGMTAPNIQMSAFSKKEAQVVRRSDIEYYSSLQTAASAMKLAHEEELLSSNKTAE